MEKIKRFLIVSATEEHGNFFRTLLREKQFQDVALCADANEALQMIDAKRIQFAIIEREMKMLSGSVLIQRIHSNRQFKHLPCLLYSASLSDSSFKLAKELGKDVLKVPLIKEQVWPVIEGICRREELVDPMEIELRKAEASIAEKQFAQAIELIKGATKSGTLSARALTLTAEALLGIGELAKAEKVLDQALQEKLNFYPAMQLLAKVYSKTKRHDKAIGLLGSMTTASPDNISSLLSLGEAYSEAEQFERAKLIFQRVRCLDPGNKDAAKELGKIAFQEGHTEAAEAFLAESDDAADLGRFFNNMAVGLVGKGQHDQAARIYEAAMRILKEKDPGMIIYLQYNLGIAMKKKGNYQLAFMLLTACCMARPSYQRAYDSLLGTVRELQNAKMKFDKDIFQRITQAHRESIADEENAESQKKGA